MAYTKERAHQFCQDIAQADLALLQTEEAKRYEALVGGDLPRDEEVFSLLYEYVVLLRAKCRKFQSLATEPSEKKSWEESAEYYDGYLNNESRAMSLVGWMWCFSVVSYRVADGDEKARWWEISLAMNRCQREEDYKARVEDMEKLIQAEIELRRNETGFLPDEYARFRREGLQPNEIDYDKCHIWR